VKYWDIPWERTSFFHQCLFYCMTSQYKCHHNWKYHRTTISEKQVLLWNIFVQKKSEIYLLLHSENEKNGFSRSMTKIRPWYNTLIDNCVVRLLVIYFWYWECSSIFILINTFETNFCISLEFSLFMLVY
jgi:hypothetical protein